MIAQRRASTTALNDPRVRSAVVALLYNNASVGVLMNLLSVPVVWLVYHDLVPTMRLNVVLALVNHAFLSYFLGLAGRSQNAHLSEVVAGS